MWILFLVLVFLSFWILVKCFISVRFVKKNSEKFKRFGEIMMLIIMLFIKICRV